MSNTMTLVTYRIITLLVFIVGIPFFHNLEEVMSNSSRICRTTHADSTNVTASALLSGIVSLILQVCSLMHNIQSLNCTIHGIKIQLFCYVIYSQVMGNENGLLTRSIPIIIPYDAIFSNNWWSVTYCLVFSNGFDWFAIGFTNDLLFHYSQ